MKLAICIPAFNEEKTIGLLIEAIPMHMQGISALKIFVVDDGSRDKTGGRAWGSAQKMAQRAGVPTNHLIEIIQLRQNKGLAHVFFTGLRKALSWGADIVVNLDGDGQYRAEEIPVLIDPLLKGEADMVLGDRQVETLKFMTWAKKYGNLAGSWFLRKLTGMKVRDASSGFRAFSRKAAESFEIHSRHTYTHENLIQAHYQGLRIAQVPVTFITRPDGTSSRLISGVLKHIFKSLQGIFGAWRRWRR